MTDADRPEVPDAEAAILDRLIAWAVSRADANVDAITAYLQGRSTANAGPGWARTYRRDELPVRGRGRDAVCSAALRRLLARHGSGSARPLGATRPPKLRRLPG